MMLKSLKLALFVMILSTCCNSGIHAQGQKWKGLSRLSQKAWRTLDRSLTVRDVYNWVNESRSTSSYYINPIGLWSSSSGNQFNVSLTKSGFVYRNRYSGVAIYCSATNTLNFYYADIGNVRYYYTLVDNSTMVINTSDGKEFWWSKR